MNRFIASVALPCLGVALPGVAVAQTAREDNNTLPGRERALNIAPGSAQPTRGVVFFTAAINSDGSIAGLFRLQRGEHQEIRGWHISDRFRTEHTSNERLEPMGSGRHIDVRH